MTRHSIGRKVGPLFGTMGRVNRQQMGPLYHLKRFQDTIQVTSSSFSSSDKSESPLLREEITGSRISLLLFRAISCTKKEGKVKSGNRSFYTKSLHKETTFQDGDSQVSKTILVNDWAVSIDLTDAYLHVPIHPHSRKYLWFIYGHQVYKFMALPFGMSLSLWIFTKLMDVIAHLRQRALSFHT